MKPLAIALLVAGPVHAEGWTVTDAPWSFRLEATTSSDPDARDIDAAAFLLRRPMRENGTLETGFEAGIVAASGTASELAGRLTFGADAVGVVGMGYAKMSPQIEGLRPFGEIAAGAMIVDRNFPDAPGEPSQSILFQFKFDLRLGLDFSTAGGTLTPAITMTHISNGRPAGADNVNYNGLGISLNYGLDW